MKKNNYDLLWKPSLDKKRIEITNVSKRTEPCCTYQYIILDITGWMRKYLILKFRHLYYSWELNEKAVIDNNVIVIINWNPRMSS